ncbi:MAG: ribosomal RNA small subunit methyltransferase A [Desulfobacterales bacterium]|nr:ribosomal RNA small subunit methyltransferase A [Desulfobacterales bacterium]
MTSPKHLLNTSNIRAKKKLGQHFLTDQSIIEKMLSGLGLSKHHTVLEIGPGLGALTIPLCRVANKVYAIEKDKQVIPLLQTQLDIHHINNIEIIEQNFLNINIADFVENTEKIVVIGNLPYYLASQILIKIVESRDCIHSAMVMIQKEMAERILANPNTKDYCRLSVFIQYYSKISHIIRVPSIKFFPKPKIDSDVILLTFYEEIKYKALNEHVLFQLVKAAFGTRRKTLKNALRISELEISDEQINEMFTLGDIDPLRRAESLSIDEFVRLSNIMCQLTSCF